MLGVEATCEQCGLIYVKQRCNQRYCCEECKKAGSRRKARAAGMTYGKYMAQEYGKQVKVERRKGNV